MSWTHNPLISDHKVATHGPKAWEPERRLDHLNMSNLAL